MTRFSATFSAPYKTLFSSLDRILKIFLTCFASTISLFVLQVYILFTWIVKQIDFYSFSLMHLSSAFPDFNKDLRSFFSILKMSCINSSFCFWLVSFIIWNVFDLSLCSAWYRSLSTSNFFFHCSWYCFQTRPFLFYSQERRYLKEECVVNHQFDYLSRLLFLFLVLFHHYCIYIYIQFTVRSETFFLFFL